MALQLDTKLKTYMVRLTEEQIVAINAEAARNDTTAARTIRRIINDYYGLTV